MPEFWLTPAAEVLKGKPMKHYFMVGFVSGERADRIMTLPQDEVKRLMLAQLDSMFGTPANPHPATKVCSAFLVRDWGKAPYARGAYTYPSPDGFGMRPLLAEPVGGRLFFAGEATQTGCNPCMQAAMETGLRASKEVTKLKP
ncbi:amine oxidase [Baffinella frigidus]|nr:amine oxidase [Cryptophyta sp. CCMP2293]